MNHTKPYGIKITDVPVADQVAADDFIPIYDSSDDALKRTSTCHSATNDAWGLGTTTEYGHVKLVDNLNSEDIVSGEVLSAHAGYELTENFGIPEIIDYAEHEHSRNEYFTYKGQLVIAIANIVKNDRLVIGGNILPTTINDGLKSAKTDISRIEEDVSNTSEDVAEIKSQLNYHKLEMDVVVQGDKYGYINNQGDFVEFKSQADIDAAVHQAMQGTAVAGDVLVGKTFTNLSDSGIVGSMPNNGAVNPAALDAGSSYTIPAGYHNGSGKVTAKSMSAQTSATASAGDIKNGQTAWVNGSKLTGTFAAQEKTVTGSRSAQNVIPDSGKYLSKVTVNKYPDANGTFTTSTNSSAVDMGATNNYRWVNTTGVYNAGLAAGRASNYTVLIDEYIDQNSYTFDPNVEPNDQYYIDRTISANTYKALLVIYILRGGGDSVIRDYTSVSGLNVSLKIGAITSDATSIDNMEFSFYVSTSCTAGGTLRFKSTMDHHHDNIWIGSSGAPGHIYVAAIT